MQAATSQFLPFHRPQIDEDDIQAVRSVMESGWITTGQKTVQFEQEFSQYIGGPHSIAVSSGTAALHLALDAIGTGPGDEVIVPTLTFAATAEAVVYCGARPVLADIEPDTFNLDPVQVRRAITARTRAIMPVHFAGQPCDMDPLLHIAQGRALRVIEDAAHALSARYRGRMVGTMGDMTCFSFYATKNITTGEGGMVTTADNAAADRMRIMRLHGISKDAWKRYSAEGSWRYEILAPGFKYNLTDMQAALGLTQLAKCDAMWQRRIALASRYTEALRDLDMYELPTTRPDVEHAWHLYVIRVRLSELSIDRDQVIEELKRRGIGVSVHFIPLHLHPYYRDHWGYRRGDFPVAEEYFDRCISLPLYPAMTNEDQERVIEALEDIATRFRRSAIIVPADAVQPTHLPVDSVPLQQPTLFQHQDWEAIEEPPAVQESHAPALSSGIYARFGKRLLDLAGSICGLIVLLPLLALCAMAVRIGSRGPVLFRQRRVGLNGRPFDLLKFRTMFTDRSGPLLTAANDPRITPVGRWMRRSKLDELPQLINVLRGEMSLVGPRPEVPRYVDGYTNAQRQVLAFRPGITSRASLQFIDEETLLAGLSDGETYYRRILLPQKLNLDLAYCSVCSLAADVDILRRTIGRLLAPNRRRAAIPADAPTAPAANVGVPAADSEAA